MSLSVGQQVELTIDKPASGGRMIARHLGQVILVRGAIPGERVHAWIERTEKRMAYAVTRDVLDPSPDRRVPPVPDPLCGGALYSHIAYPRQLQIKSDVIRDAFARLGRHPLDAPIEVTPSPEAGYRMRARCHVHGARAGFYREGTHQLCDAGPTAQLLPKAAAAIVSLADALHREAPGSVASIALSENIAGDARAAHLELAAGARVMPATLAQAAAAAGLTGISARDLGTGQLVAAGAPVVADPLSSLIGGVPVEGELLRHAESFFQGNRYLLASLVAAVIEAVPGDGEVLDLYAGVGLFAVSLAASGHLEVTAVEGDRASGADLRHNARAHEPRLAAHVARVEDYLAARRGLAGGTVVVDPPRTGVSAQALEAIVGQRGQRPSRLVYVSCDPATLARDARRLLDAGYALQSLRAFDFFPTTPHIESLAVFTAHDGGLPRQSSRTGR